ncbi:MAG TPA: DRTGG domain-containing protein, partial [Candidatus Udaeobacter sp.]|nr:DRTGG domain-containing protein [Candidatus Udaeobacter sp.]
MAPIGPGNETSTKHEQILNYIQSLKIGTKISVRAIAKALGVSEGTAYKAFKEAESSGLVSTKERIGTVRIDRKRREALDQLTFGEVAEIVEGRLFGGAAGLDKTLHKFVIGAMELDAMLRYIDEGSLLIVGNRIGAHRCALEEGAGVLITGGFEPSAEVIKLADERILP